MRRRGDLASVFAQSRATRLINRAGQLEICGLLNRADDGAAHPAADTADDNSNRHSVLQQTKIPHRLCELLEISLGHRRERQTEIAAALAHERQRGLDGNWIRLDEQIVNQRDESELKLASLFPVAF